MHIKMLVAVFEPTSFPSSPFAKPPVSFKGKERAPPPEVIDLLSGSETEDEDGLPMSLSRDAKGKGKAAEVEVETKEEHVDEDKRVKGWWYMGSHNFTPSAWGTVSMGKDGTPSQAVGFSLSLLFRLSANLTLRTSILPLFTPLPSIQGANYELGIILVRARLFQPCFLFSSRS